MQVVLDAPALPEIAEAAAPAHIREIFAEIRQWTGVPVVALIFRNLATFPGVIEEIWEALGPIFRTGQIQEVAWRVARETVPTDLLPPIEANARAAIGLTGEAFDSLGNLLDSYNRANPVNLLSMLSLLARMRAHGPARPVSADNWSPPTAVSSQFPPMTSLDAISPDLRRLINDLGFSDRSTSTAIVPSLYRHLTDWPAYLAIIHVTLVPRFRDGSLARAAQQLQQVMISEAAAIAAHIPPIRRLHAAQEVEATLTHFTTTVIPQMIVVGHAMKSALR